MRRFAAALAAGLLSVVALASAACAPGLAFAAGVTADTEVHIKGQYTAPNALGAPVFTFDQRGYTKFTEGTAATVAPSHGDKMYAATRTLSASATEDLDLAGVLTDPFGVALTFVKVKLIWVHASAANTNNVVIGGASSNGFLGPFGGATFTVAIPPGGSAFFTAPAAGWSVTASTGDLFHVANSGGTTGVTYDVIIIGASA